MRINQRSKEELANALKAVEAALAAKRTKTVVLKTLSEMGWCSSGSAGVEKSFLTSLRAKEVPLTTLFAQLMSEGAESGPAEQAETAERQAEPPLALQPEGHGDFTVVNLKAVSLMQTKNDHTDVRFIGSENGLSGNIAVSVLRSSCNLIEFAI